MFVYMFMRLFVHSFICSFVYACIYVCMRLFIYVCKRVFVCLFMRLCICACICVFARLHNCTNTQSAYCQRSSTVMSTLPPLLCIGSVRIEMMQYLVFCPARVTVLLGMYV